MRNTFQHNLDKVIERWKRDKLSLLPPATENEILAAFRQIGHPVSQDVFQLYSTIGGMEDYTSDGITYWSLWSLERIVEENNAKGYPHFWFADFLINSHFYALKYETPEESAVYLDYLDSAPPTFLKASLSDFFETYLNSSEDLDLF